MSEPVFHDKEEAWAYYAGQKKAQWESLSDEELIAHIGNGNYDMFFTLPEVVAARLPREKAILALFRKVVEQDTDYLVNYHTLDNLLKILGNKDGMEAQPADPLYEKVLRGFYGEENRRSACREFWQRILVLYPKLAAETIDFAVPQAFLQSSFEIVYRYGGTNFSFYHAGKPFSVQTFEEVLLHKFEKFRSYAWFGNEARLSFEEDTTGRRARITGFHFACEVTVHHAVGKPVVAEDVSPGPWYLDNPIRLVKRGERNFDLENTLADIIINPLGIEELNYSRLNT